MDVGGERRWDRRRGKRKEGGVVYLNVTRSTRANFAVAGEGRKEGRKEGRTDGRDNKLMRKRESACARTWLVN